MFVYLGVSIYLSIYLGVAVESFLNIKPEKRHKRQIQGHIKLFTVFLSK